MKANSLSMYMHRRKNRYMSAPILLVETSTVNRYGAYLMIWINTSSLYDTFLVASADWFFDFFQVTWGKVSMVEAERRLLANALLDPDNQHFVLLSDR